MVLKYFFPEKDFPMQRLLDEFRTKPGMWSQPSQAAVVLDKLGVEAKYFATSDEERYLREGEAYVRSTNDARVAEDILKHSDLENDAHFVRLALSQGLFERKKLLFADLEEQVDEGRLVVAVLNMNVFKNKQGYQGHFVLLTGMDEKNVTYHDPDRGPNRETDKGLFSAAFEGPGTDNTAVIAFGRKR